MNANDFQCVLKRPAKQQKLKSKKWNATLKGTFVNIPSSLLFITEDGSVFVVTNNRHTYTSLDSLVKTVNATKIVENFSE